MTHTPGPWSASKDKDARGWYGWRIDSDSRALMAWAAWPSEIERDDIEAEATARLIAAAPDLAAACVKLIEGADKNTSPLKREILDAIVLARAAIAKATGVTE